jgi:hypothetical protein
MCQGKKRANYFLGLDLGQPHEHSALAVIERTRRAADPDGLGRKQRHHAVRQLLRLPPGTSYPAMAQDLDRLLGKMRRPRGAVIDATAVGRSVVDLVGQGLPCRVFAVAYANLFVTCKRVNQRMRLDVEGPVLDWLAAGLPVDYEVELVYTGTSLYPGQVKMRAIALEPTSLSASATAEPRCREINRWTNPIQAETDVRHCPGAR